MRTLRKNRQKMYYALFDHSEEMYKKDKDGNPIVEYVDEDGNVYYRGNGTTRSVYKTPIEFYAPISSNLNEMHAREYGIDQTSIYSELTVGKGELPLDLYGALIWRTSPIEWEDEAQTVPKADSADYTVKGILDEFLNFDFYLLQRNNKETK